MSSDVQSVLNYWMPRIKALEDALQALKDAKEERFEQIVLDCLECFLNDPDCTEYDAN